MRHAARTLLLRAGPARPGLSDLGFGQSAWGLLLLDRLPVGRWIGIGSVWFRSEVGFRAGGFSGACAVSATAAAALRQLPACRPAAGPLPTLPHRRRPPISDANSTACGQGQAAARSQCARQVKRRSTPGDPIQRLGDLKQQAGASLRSVAHGGACGKCSRLHVQQGACRELEQCALALLAPEEAAKRRLPHALPRLAVRALSALPRLFASFIWLSCDPGFHCLAPRGRETAANMTDATVVDRDQLRGALKV